jgi:hypothetical protein
VIKMVNALEPRDLRLIDTLHVSLKEGDDATLLTAYGKIAYLYRETGEDAFLPSLRLLEEKGYTPPQEPIALPSCGEVKERLHLQSNLPFKKKLNYLELLCDLLLAERTRQELLKINGFKSTLRKYASALSKTEDPTLRRVLEAYSSRHIKLYPIGELLCKMY